MSNKFAVVCLVSLFWLTGCTKAQPPAATPTAPPVSEMPDVPKIKNPGRVVYVLVALCDNEHQGIVPVPAFLGNGDDPEKNLYWGAGYGVRTYFSKSASWEKLAEFENPKPNVLRRIVFKHRATGVYLVADAYQGSKMRETVGDFFAAVAGARRENVAAGSLTLQIGGSADLVAFVGHNGLMDFELENQPEKRDDDPRDAVVLACASRRYFAGPLKKTSARPLLWTSNLMAPESYILHDALEGWVRDESAEQIRDRAAAAYAKYQRIGFKSAQNLLVTGW
ncbi:MAG: hypothetical protein JSS81_12525 [Acidobacteria bacterium]|nr:hypothetical protein [Acidobacteriota bacterium]